MKKTVVCVACSFPPSSVSGSHRTRAVVRYLPSFGWRPIVVAPQLSPEEGRDDSLLVGLPPNLVVYRTRAPQLLSWGNRMRGRIRRLLRSSGEQGDSPRTKPPSGGERRDWIDWASWWLQMPDLSSGWLPWGVAAALDALNRYRGVAVYSSAPHWTAHLVGWLASRIGNRPWIADFRDPWRGNPFRKLPYESLNRLDCWLERQVVEGADRVICNSRQVQADFEGRYPHLNGRFTTIPNGFDPEDYAGLLEDRPVGRDCLLLTHAGLFYGPRRPHALLEAVRLLGEQGVGGRPIRIQLIGPRTYEGRPLESIAADFGVASRVLVRGEVPHRRVLEALAGSDALLLVGFSGQGAELQVPGKLFEYLGVGRPILALAPREGAIADVLGQSAAPSELCDPDDPREVAEAIRRLAEKLGQTAGDTAEPTRNSRFHRREQVARMAELLDDVTFRSEIH